MNLLMTKGKIFLTAFCCLLLSACFKDKVTRTYTLQKPVFASKAAVLANIKAVAAHPVKESGKIYIYGNWIFMSDPARGIHIIDNTNPSNPQPKAFIELPGNLDIAVKGNALYADLFTDLLVLDISNPLSPVLKEVIPQAFPDRTYVNGYYLQPDQVIIDWIKKDTTVSVEDVWVDVPGANCPTCSFAQLYSGSSKTPVGKGGSMARLTIVNENLFLVNTAMLKSYSILSEFAPALQGDLQLGWGIETVYPFNDKLFIGSSNGMYIADIQNPAQPQLLGSFQHATACDPVVGDDQYAYVTLRTGNFCAGVLNQLDILNVSNVMQPTLVKSFPMSNPHGLGINGDDIYVCDGSAGLKVYDGTNKSSIQLKQHLDIADAFDILINGNLALVVGRDGLYQFRIKADGKLELLSLYKYAA